MAHGCLHSRLEGAAGPRAGAMPAMLTPHRRVTARAQDAQEALGGHGGRWLGGTDGGWGAEIREDFEPVVRVVVAAQHAQPVSPAS